MPIDSNARKSVIVNFIMYNGNKNDIIKTDNGVTITGIIDNEDEALVLLSLLVNAEGNATINIDNGVIIIAIIDSEIGGVTSIVVTEANDNTIIAID